MIISALLVAVILAAFASTTFAEPAKKPLKIFILAGQSNMVGIADFGLKATANLLQSRLEQPQRQSLSGLAIGCRIGRSLQRFADSCLLGKDLGHCGPPYLFKLFCFQ